MTSCLLFAHGSRDPVWRAPFERLTDDLSETLGPGAVRLAYLEFVEPTLGAAIREAVGEGHGTIRILPLFLASGVHVREDLPGEIERLRVAHPGTTVARRSTTASSSAGGTIPPTGGRRAARAYGATRAIRTTSSNGSTGSRTR